MTDIDLSNVKRLPFLYTSEEMLDWTCKYVVLWNAEYRQSYDTVTHEYVVEIVYSDGKCDSARSSIPAQALQRLIDNLGGLDATSLV